METEKTTNTEADLRTDKESILMRGEIEKVGGPISLEKAKKWNQNYRRMNSTDTTSHLFGREVFERILRQKGCAGIRIHYCIDDLGKKQLILSGVDHNGIDQLPRENQTLKTNSFPHALQAAGDDEYEVFDQSWPCPGSRGCPAHDLIQG